MSLTWILVALAVMLFVILPVTFALYRSWKVPQSWSALQQERGLEDEADEDDEEAWPESLSGDVRGKDVDVWIDTDIAARGKSGPDHAHYTNIVVPLDTGDDSQVCIQQTGVRSRIVRTVMTGPGGFNYKSEEIDDGGDTDVGDDAFDERFEIAGELTDELATALETPSIRGLIDELLSSSAELHIERSKVRYTIPGRVAGQQKLIGRVDAVVEIAIGLDNTLDGSS